MLPWQSSKAITRAASTAGLDAQWVAKNCAKLLDGCHPKQRSFVEDPHRRVSALVGRRGGKTTGQRARFLLRMFRTPRAQCVYIALTRPSAEELMWGPLKDVCERLGLRVGIDVSFNETKLKMTLLRNGSTLRIVGADDKKEIEKLRGHKFHEVAIDEAASFSARLLENLIDRVIGPALGDYKGCLVMFGTPGHILDGPFYEATRPGSPSHRRYEDRELPEYARWLSWSSHQWTLLDGAPYVPAMASAWEEALIEKEAKGWSDTHPVWCREWLGRWAADATENVYKYRAHLDDGAAWNQWDPKRVGPMQVAELPPGFSDWCFGFGMDMGHGDPFALEAFAFSPSDTSRTLYHVFEFQRREMYARLIADLLLGEERDHDRPAGVIGALGWPIGMVADLAGLGDSVLDELRMVYGITIKGAEKGYKYKFPAIELFNGDLIDGRVKILKGSILETQMLNLQWRADEYGALTENKTQANDASDAAIYCRLLVAHLFDAGKVAAPPPVKTVQSQHRTEPEEPDDRQGREDFSALLADGEYRDAWGGSW